MIPVQSQCKAIDNPGAWVIFLMCDGREMLIDRGMERDDYLISSYSM